VKLPWDADHFAKKAKDTLEDEGEESESNAIHGNIFNV
jgi:hypothetical protein